MEEEIDCFWFHKKKEEEREKRRKNEKIFYYLVVTFSSIDKSSLPFIPFHFSRLEEKQFEKKKSSRRQTVLEEGMF